MLATNYGSNSLTRLLGDGRGGFTGVRNFATGPRPYAVASADFDGDGVPDVVVTDSGSGDLQIFPGERRGGFANPLKVSAGSRPRGVAVGDFNRDGRADIAFADSVTNKVVVLINDCR